MKNLQKKILRRSKSIRRPARKAATRGITKFRIGSVVGLMALALARKRRRAKHPARPLRNKQGIGPAHIKGVMKAEERGMKHGHNEKSHAAGRFIGSIHPA
jgi:hypothetical protein